MESSAARALGGFAHARTVGGTVWRGADGHQDRLEEAAGDNGRERRKLRARETEGGSQSGGAIAREQFKKTTLPLAHSSARSPERQTARRQGPRRAGEAQTKNHPIPARKIKIRIPGRDRGRGPTATRRATAFPFGAPETQTDTKGIVFSKAGAPRHKREDCCSSEKLLPSGRRGGAR